MAADDASLDSGAGLAALLEMGFDDSAAAEALVATRGDLAAAAARLLYQGPAITAALSDAGGDVGFSRTSVGGSSSHDHTLAVAHPATGREARIRNAIAALPAPPLGLAAAEAVDTLLAVTGNVLQQPSDPRFRSLKRSNKRLARALAAFPGGLVLLDALGFTGAGGDWSLTRPDLGLFWLTQQLLQQARVTLSPQQAPV
jgi:hypothetical protein